MHRPVDPRLLHPTIPWIEETEAQAISRYRGFAYECIEELIKRHPELRGRMTFLRDPSCDDLWAFVARDSYSFGLQLDPDCRVICCWTSESAVEFGDWMDTPTAASIDWIETQVPWLAEKQVRRP